jgi:hypothetical protein
MKYLKKFNEEYFGHKGEEQEEGPNKTLDFFTDLSEYHKENDVDSSCHTELDNFVSYLSDKYTREVINTELSNEEESEDDETF